MYVPSSSSSSRREVADFDSVLLASRLAQGSPTGYAAHLILCVRSLALADSVSRSGLRRPADFVSAL